MYNHDAADWISYDLINKGTPVDILHIGCGNGTLIRRFEVNNKINTKGIESDRNNYLTRVSNNVIEWDLNKIPWPIKDKEFHVSFSHALLNQFKNPESIVNEIKRVSHVGIHTIDFANSNVSGNRWKELFGPTFHIVDFNIINCGMSNISFNRGALKFNLGCGNILFHWGWINIDKIDLSKDVEHGRMTFHQHDARDWIPTDNNKVTSIIISHLLNEFSTEEAKKVLSECWRTLAIGGIVRITLPDIEKVQLMGDELSELAFLRNFKYSKEDILNMLYEAGFSKINFTPFLGSSSEHLNKETFDTYPDFSFYIEARKMVL